MAFRRISLVVLLGVSAAGLGCGSGSPSASPGSLSFGAACTSSWECSSDECVKFGDLASPVCSNICVEKNADGSWADCSTQSCESGVELPSASNQFPYCHP